MHVPPTLAVFATILAGLVLLRLSWPRLPSRLRSTLIVLAFTAIVLQCLSSATRWSTINDGVNLCLYWAAITSYELVVILGTRLRPHWLTAVIAVVLILPLFSASIFLPLTDLFDHPQHHIEWLDRRLFTETTPWGSVSNGTSGVDIGIFTGNPRIPLLRHLIAGTRFFNSQCNATAAVAVLQPDRKSVLLTCPSWSGEPTEGYLLQVF